MAVQGLSRAENLKPSHPNGKDNVLCYRSNKVECLFDESDIISDVVIFVK